MMLGKYVKSEIRRGGARGAKKPALGTGERFARLEKSLAAGGAKKPGALAAWIGRRKMGKARFQRLAAAGKKGY